MGYISSRFNVTSRTDDKELILYNSYTGAIVNFSKKEEEKVLLALHGEVIDDKLLYDSLIDSGFIVRENINEDKRAQFLHQAQHRTDTMHLAILPTEECNYRCIYCYETFSRGEMTKDVREGLKNYVNSKASALKVLSVSWFGGEPLLAPNVIEELSLSFIETAKQYNIEYNAEISTNGYFLTEDMFSRLIKWNINSFMVTIDGPKETHDARRRLRGGGGTFDKIMRNLKRISEQEGNFEIHIRVNFDDSTLNKIPNLIEIIKENFGDDKRFQIYFRPVGRWGGENDDLLQICDNRTADKKIWEFTELALKKGINMSSYVDSVLTPSGAVCYAAKPNSLVVSSNGKLHKCTLAFEDDINQIGQINSNGYADIDYDKLAHWVTSGEEEDKVCQSCFFRPACQGNHCPYYRMQTGERPCSYEKNEIKKVLNLIWRKYTSI